MSRYQQLVKKAEKVVEKMGENGPVLPVRMASLMIENGHNEALKGNRRGASVIYKAAEQIIDEATGIAQILKYDLRRK